MNSEKNKKKKNQSQIESGDALGRILSGTPTIGGAIVMGIILIIVLYNIFA
ncbi:hypothetical protein GKZ89_12165 [Bacillus mangrovi]|uniref:Uncharacterized protein n=1 Tax=Metabacillus mangrovi TaxID=1491830 RepID=A0A7X2S5Q5_9BACI|nr:hypothetical protein [Metabacillus mangrovi]MTH54159.1 hypothetical protein [Metabacillus mangrovi]